MARSDDFFTRAVLVQIDLPGGAVRLSVSGGVAKWGADLFVADDAQFGAVTQIDGVDEALGDIAPGGQIILAIPDAVAQGSVYSAALAGVRVRVWDAEVTPATGLVAGVPVMHSDALVDTVGWRVASRELVLGLVSRAEKFFAINRGNVAGSAFHKNIWAGERGFDNCTDVPRQMAWGTAGPPRGVSAGGGVGGGGGGFSRPGVNFL